MSANNLLIFLHLAGAPPPFHSFPPHPEGSARPFQRLNGSSATPPPLSPRLQQDCLTGSLMRAPGKSDQRGRKRDAVAPSLVCRLMKESGPHFGREHPVAAASPRLSTPARRSSAATRRHFTDKAVGGKKQQQHRLWHFFFLERLLCHARPPVDLHGGDWQPDRSLHSGLLCWFPREDCRISPRKTTARLPLLIIRRVKNYSGL